MSTTTPEVPMAGRPPSVDKVLRAVQAARETVPAGADFHDYVLQFYAALEAEDAQFQCMVWLPETQHGVTLNCGAYLDAVVDDELAVLFAANPAAMQAGKDALIEAKRAAKLPYGLLLSFRGRADEDAPRCLLLGLPAAPARTTEPGLES